MATATIVPAEIEDQRLIREKLAELRLPAGVAFHDLRLTDNWLGELVWRIDFAVSKQTRLTPEFISEIEDIQQTLRFALLDAGITYRPDTHLVDAG